MGDTQEDTTTGWITGRRVVLRRVERGRADGGRRIEGRCVERGRDGGAHVEDEEGRAAECVGGRVEGGRAEGRRVMGLDGERAKEGGRV